MCVCVSFCLCHCVFACVCLCFCVFVYVSVNVYTVYACVWTSLSDLTCAEICKGVPLGVLPALGGLHENKGNWKTFKEIYTFLKTYCEC